MAGFQYIEGILHIDNLPVTALAERFGTPAYIYSATLIRENFHALQKALMDALPADRQPLIAYACKANSNIAVIKLLAGMGAGIDTVSGGEMARAKKAGIEPNKIVLSGVGKTDAEIREAIEGNILQINVESAAEMTRIAAIAEDTGQIAKIAFRLNPDVDAKTHEKITTGKHENKFGMPAGEIESLYRQATENPYLDPQGLSIHIGSQLTDLKPFADSFEILAAFTQKLREGGMNVRSLDLGGGIGITYEKETPPSLDAYAALIRDIIPPLETTLILEPGRSLLGNAGILLTQATYLKHGTTRDFLIIDAAMNDLARPSLYDAYHPLWPVKEPEGNEFRRYDIVGPVCETGDTFAKSRDLPPLGEGDLIAIGAAGAYGFVMASNYNTRPMPPEILVDGSNAALIRPREEIQDIIGKDTVPEWL